MTGTICLMTKEMKRNIIAVHMFATSAVCQTVYGVLSKGTMGLHEGGKEKNRRDWEQKGCGESEERRRGAWRRRLYRKRGKKSSQEFFLYN